MRVRGLAQTGLNYGYALASARAPTADWPGWAIVTVGLGQVRNPDAAAVLTGTSLPAPCLVREDAGNLLRPGGFNRHDLSPRR